MTTAMARARARKDMGRIIDPAVDSRYNLGPLEVRMARRSAASLIVLLCAVLCAAVPSAAQTPDPDRAVDPAQPDFTLSALPTTMRLPAGAFGFRLTHRFTRPIDSGSTGDFFRDFFGFDSAARIGLELRYGLRPGTQVAVYRTNDRAIQLSAQQSLMQQSDSRWISLDAFVAVDGADNFTEDYATTLGAVVSHVFTKKAAIYAHPLYVWNVAEGPAVEGAPDWSMCLGLGIRYRLGQSKVYVVAEAAPQLGGLKDGVDHLTFAVERRAGAHMFQFTVSNNLGTSMRQVARGGTTPGDWYVGFNLTRRFY